ncbi:MAG: TIGR02679 family protein [Firmicutes bacterium]|nr:TIGR02679 family protein [Bacillota bacterium]
MSRSLPGRRGHEPSPAAGGPPAAAARPASGAAAAAAYLRTRPFGRLMDACLRTFTRLSRIGGRAYIQAPTSDELNALEGLLGRPMRPGADGRLAVSLLELDRHFRESTRFRCGLAEILEAYFGEPVLTREDLRAWRHGAWEAFVAGLKDLLELPAAAQWWSASGGGEEQARRLFRAAVQDLAADLPPAAVLTSPAVQDLRRALRHCALALVRLPGTGGGVPLPVFAQRITGNPHAFDAGTLAGRLLETALATLLAPSGASPGTPGQPAPAAGDALDGAREASLVAAGLLRDDVSSLVLCYGLAEAVTGDGRPVAAVEAARRDRAVVAWPLREVRRWSTAGARGHRVFIVENPSVFSLIVERLRTLDTPDASSGEDTGPPTIICTSGQPSAAATRLLDLLAAADCALHYSGDFDPQGLSIAAGLRARYGDRFTPWRMDSASYRLALERAGLPGEECDPYTLLDDEDEGLLERLRPAFPDVVAEMLKERRKAYQEGLVEELAEDVAALRS